MKIDRAKLITATFIRRDEIEEDGCPIFCDLGIAFFTALNDEHKDIMTRDAPNINQLIKNMTQHLTENEKKMFDGVVNTDRSIERKILDKVLDRKGMEILKRFLNVIEAQRALEKAYSCRARKSATAKPSKAYRGPRTAIEPTKRDREDDSTTMIAENSATVPTAASGSTRRVKAEPDHSRPQNNATEAPVLFKRQRGHSTTKTAPNNATVTSRGLGKS